MRELPILFSAPMVRAILEGRKTVTRRVVNPQPYVDGSGNFCWNGWNYGQDIGRRPHVQAIASPLPTSRTKRVLCPYGAVGDRLWVREAHAIFSTHGQRREDGLRWGPWGGLPTTFSPDGSQIAYFREGFDRCDPGRWRPSIHMPRWASRITLEVTGVRVERLQDITEEQALAEGIRELPLQKDEPGAWWCADPLGNPELHCRTPRAAFCRLWESINGAGSWADNPWVWVVEFKRIDREARAA